MDQSKQRGITILALVIIVIGGFYVWKRDHGAPDTIDTATTTDPIVALVPDTSASKAAVSAMEQNNITGQPVAKSGVPAPDFKTPITCTLAADACEAVRKQQADIISTLTSKKTDFDSWITLGMLYKMSGDYKGAAVMWEYVSAIYPQNTTSFPNLGDLYMNFLHDEAKAEKSYLMAIANKSDNIDAYRTLFTLYTTGFRGGSAAEDILKKGIVANPKAVELHVLLARYYKSQDRVADAKAQYAAAIESAQSQGQTALAAEIKKESDAI